MTSNHSFPQHRTHRLSEFDYSQPGAYFVTIVTRDRRTLFGQIVEGEIVLSNIGKMVEQVWIAIPDHFPNVECGEFVIMPNHFHGIVTITVGARHAVPQQDDAFESFSKPVSGSLATIIRSFKSATTKAFHEFPGNSDDSLWQQSYYDHVIRNERELQAIDDYIIANPMNWEKDEEFNNLEG